MSKEHKLTDTGETKALILDDGSEVQRKLYKDEVVTTAYSELTIDVVRDNIAALEAELVVQKNLLSQMEE